MHLFRNILLNADHLALFLVERRKIYETRKLRPNNVIRQTKQAVSVERTVRAGKWPKVCKEKNCGKAFRALFLRTNTASVEHDFRRWIWWAPFAKRLSWWRIPLIRAAGKRLWRRQALGVHLLNTSRSYWKPFLGQKTSKVKSTFGTLNLSDYHRHEDHSMRIIIVWSCRTYKLTKNLSRKSYLLEASFSGQRRRNSLSQKTDHFRIHFVVQTDTSLARRLLWSQYQKLRKLWKLGILKKFALKDLSFWSPLLQLTWVVYGSYNTSHIRGRFLFGRRVS